MKPFKMIAAALVLTLVATSAAAASDGQARGGGQDITVFDIVDS